MSNDPRNSELCLLMVILNLDSVSDFHLTSATAKLHAMVADIEGMCEMASCTPSDPNAYWHDRLGSL
ncbi:MAG TPA: hypothetical protein VIH75_22535 [Candidatus Sulfotelmatobacter sp.]